MEKLLVPEVLVPFAAFIVPGFIAMRVWGLVRPGDALSTKDSAVDLIVYGLLIFSLGYAFGLVTTILRDPSFANRALAAVVVFAILPVLLPIALNWLLRHLQSTGLITYGDRRAWDHFFQRRRPCWLVFHLKDGTKLGGYFGHGSYATLYPHSGSIYVAEQWEVELDTGKIVGDDPIGDGFLLRHDDYVYVEVRQTE